MTVDKIGVVQIGGSVETIGDIREFLAVIETFGLDDSTRLANGFLTVERVGVPVAVVGDDGATRAIVELSEPEP